MRLGPKQEYVDFECWGLATASTAPSQTSWLGAVILNDAFGNI